MPHIRFDLGGRSLPERILYGALLVIVLVLGFFFLVAALIAGAVLGAVMLARYWWLRRKLEKQADAEFISTEYTVVEEEKPGLPSPGPDERR